MDKKAQNSKSKFLIEETIFEERGRFSIINIFNSKYELFLKLKDKIAGYFNERRIKDKGYYPREGGSPKQIENAWPGKRKDNLHGKKLHEQLGKLNSSKRLGSSMRRKLRL
jgi:hypothetical protein